VQTPKPIERPKTPTPVEHAPTPVEVAVTQPEFVEGSSKVPMKRSVEVEVKEMEDEREAKRRRIDARIDRVERIEGLIAEMVWGVQKEIKELKKELRK
jgi:hypothetical protein